MFNDRRIHFGPTHVATQIKSTLYPVELELIFCWVLVDGIMHCLLTACYAKLCYELFRMNGRAAVFAECWCNIVIVRVAAKVHKQRPGLCGGSLCRLMIVMMIHCHKLGDKYFEIRY